MYDNIMNSEKNPLRNLPRSVRLQVMVALSWMWSLIFGLWIGSTLAFGASVAAHMLLLVGVFATTEIFRRAEERSRGFDEKPANAQEVAEAHEDLWGSPDATHSLRPATVPTRSHANV
jgi:hypothetical protein